MELHDLVVGIDVGVTGAIGVIDRKSMTVIDCLNVPVETMKNKRRRIDAVVLSDWFDTLVDSFTPCKVLVIIEHVHSRPNDGHMQAFSFGDSFGVLRGLFGSKTVRVEYVSPLKWKGYFGMKGTHKDYSRTVAKQKFISMGDDVLKFKKDHNKADALLIALYGAEKC